MKNKLSILMACMSVTFAYSTASSAVELELSCPNGYNLQIKNPGSSERFTCEKFIAGVPAVPVSSLYYKVNSRAAEPSSSSAEAGCPAGSTLIRFTRDGSRVRSSNQGEGNDLVACESSKVDFIPVGIFNTCNHPYQFSRANARCETLKWTYSTVGSTNKNPKTSAAQTLERRKKEALVAGGIGCIAAGSGIETDLNRNVTKCRKEIPGTPAIQERVHNVKPNARGV